MKFFLRLIICIAAAASTLCSYAQSTWRDSLISRLGYYSRTGQHDSVIAVSHHEICAALEREDTLAALYTEIFTAQSYLFMDDASAEEYYKKALSYIEFSDYTTHIQLLLHYGDFLEGHGYNNEAMSMYVMALDVSERSKSSELKHLVLSKAADLAFRLGDKKQALNYYRDARIQTDSLVELRNNEFSKLMFMNQDIRHSQDLLAKELDRQKAYEYLKVSTLVAILVIAVSAMLIILYIRQRKMYRTLVEQHRANIKRLDMRLAGNNEETENDDLRLFRKIDSLMRDGKYYLNKDITLDSLAKTLGTNRTYCSNAINACAGMNFYRYIDTFRIEEATRRLIDGGNPK